MLLSRYVNKSAVDVALFPRNENASFRRVLSASDAESAERVIRVFHFSETDFFRRTEKRVATPRTRFARIKRLSRYIRTMFSL